jgi:hypothetical protein
MTLVNWPCSIWAFAKAGTALDTRKSMMWLGTQHGPKEPLVSAIVRRRGRRVGIFQRFTLAVILIGIVPPVAGARSEARGGTTVSGTVSVFPSDPLARLAGAKVAFQDSDGSAVETVTNSTGEYTASLIPGHDYAVSVTSTGFCAVHRPASLLRPSSTVRFDFTMTPLCAGDRIAWSPNNDKTAQEDAYFNSSIPYYFEERVALGKSHLRTLIIAFGKRNKTDALVEYFPLPSREHPEVRMPVTITFDTYTVKADSAVIERGTRVLRADGNVSVADGTDSPQRTASCVALRLDDPDPQVQTCQRSNQDPASKP